MKKEFFFVMAVCCAMGIFAQSEALTMLAQSWSCNPFYLKLLCGYMAMQACFYVWEKLYGDFRQAEGHVCLEDRAENSGFGLGLISQTFDYFVLNRYSFLGYRNAVRANLRLVSSLSMTFLVCAVSGLWIHHFMEKSSDLWKIPTFLSVAGFCLSSFLLERKSVHDKWLYLSGRHAKMIETEPGVVRDLLENSFVSDLIETEMWSHRSFQGAFEDSLARAYAEHRGAYPFKMSDLKYARQELMEARLPKKVAMDVMKSQRQRLNERQRLEALKKAG